jgi:hypothetical protein
VRDTVFALFARSHTRACVSLDIMRSPPVPGRDDQVPSDAVCTRRQACHGEFDIARQSVDVGYRFVVAKDAEEEIVGLCRPRDYADRGVNGLVGGVGTAGWSA